MTTIAEEVLLLAYGEEGRQLIGSSELDAALGGALLAELAVAGRIDLSDRKVAVPDERAAVLIAILHAARIDRKAFPGASKERIKEITEGEWAGKAVSQTIAAVNSAVMAAVMAGVVVTTVS